jgi:hypothetical protein
MFTQMAWTRFSLYTFCLKRQKNKQNSYQDIILQLFNNSTADPSLNTLQLLNCISRYLKYSANLLLVLQTAASSKTKKPDTVGQ